MPYPTFRLEGVVRTSGNTEDFEGPLALILQLLSKNKIEIQDIKISLILDQYLEYLDEMKKMDLEIASEFVTMASHLVYIKARTLLSDDESVSELESLISSLEELRLRRCYEGIKEATAYFEKRATHGFDVFVRQREVQTAAALYAWSHGAAELRDALIAMHGRDGGSPSPSPGFIMPARLVYPVGEKTEELLTILRDAGRLALKEIYAGCRGRSELVASFMAVLELMRSGAVSLTEAEDGYVLERTKEDGGSGH